MENSVLLIGATIALVALVDYVPRAFLFVKKATKVTPRRGRTPNFLIMPTVYGNISYLQNLNFLKKYKEHVVICTSLYETDEFYTQLTKVCRKNGLRFIKADLPKANGKPIRNAYTIYKGAFQELKALGVKKHTPCILIDADTYSHENVDNLVKSFARSQADIASLRCEVAEPTRVIEKLQAFEYKMAMDNRRMDPWLTSGACNIGKASVFQSIFANHSNFFAGGDIEIGKIASVMGYRIKHINFKFYTAVPDTLKSWYNQRVIWFAGGFRHHVTNIASYGWYHFFLFFYNTLLIYLLFPLRWVELLNFPLTMLFLIMLSWIYTFILVGKSWDKVLLLLPFYSFIQSMIIIPAAFVRYIKLCVSQRSLGVLKYNLSHKSWTTKLTFKLLNLASASFVIYAAYMFTAFRLQYWLQNGQLMKLFFRQVYLFPGMNDIMTPVTRGIRITANI